MARRLYDGVEFAVELQSFGMTKRYNGAYPFGQDGNNPNKRHPGVTKCSTYRNNVEVLCAIESFNLPTCGSFDYRFDRIGMWSFLTLFTIC
jgi:hypothetical protein